MERLSFRPVTASEVDVRVQSINSYKTTLLLYKDARVDQNILDETVGPFNWKRAHTRDNANCIVSLWDEEKKEWVSKEDTGTESNTEKEKGLASDSFKRACFCWGIGRELYTAPLVQIKSEYIDINNTNGRMGTYDKFYVDHMKVETDDKGIKLITELVIGIEHKGKRDIVWRWSKDTNFIEDCQPSWIGSSSASSGGFGKSSSSTTTKKRQWGVG